MRSLLFAAALLVLGTAEVHAQAIPNSAGVLNGCGTAQSYILGQNRPVTQDTHGGLCNSPTVGATFSPTQSVLSTSAAQVLPAGTYSARIVCNLDAAIVVWIGPSGVGTGTGIPVQPGGCWDVTHTSAAIYAVAAAGTPAASSVQY